MRHSDDIADDPATDRARAADTSWGNGLRRSTASLPAEPTDDPVLLALADAQRRIKIPLELLDQLADGTAMDIEEPEPRSRPLLRVLLHAEVIPPPVVQYKTFDDLYHYCYHVASVVGLVCIRIFGYRDPAAEALAERCGLAFQLTNIIRDVKEDAAMGRVYIPQEDLTGSILRHRSSRAGQGSGPHPSAAGIEAERAREFYRAADQLIPLIDEDSRPALWVLVEIYRRLLEKIASRRLRRVSAGRSGSPRARSS